MATLGSLAQLIRSKNAGPWNLTVDIMFPDAKTYQHVVDANVLTAEVASDAFKVAADKISIYHYYPANAIKISFPRRLPNGHPLDRDVFGGQQFAPIYSLEVPDLT